MKKFYDVEEKVPLLQGIPLSLQHLFAMFGSTVLVPFLLHVNPATALFMNGIGTILYLIICKGKLPAYLGSSFAFISPVLAVLATSGLSYGDAQGGFIAFGLSFIILSFVVGKLGTAWIDIILPPAAMGAVVAVIGLELAPLALDMSGFISDTMQSQGIPNELAMITSVFTLAVAILASVIGRGFLSVIPVLIGVIAGYIMAFCLGIVDWSGVEAASWVQVPTFYEPTFNIHAIMIIMPALFVVFAEHIGHVVVTSSIVDRDLIKNPGLNRSLFADGVSNVLSGFVGSTPNTTYGENMGVMAITRVYSVWVIGGAAIFAILFSFIGKIAAIIHAIPVPVMGGISVLLFGVIACSGTHDLTGCELYTSCYPCPMCLSATIWANIKKVYYGNTAKDADKIGFRDDFIYNYIEGKCQDISVLDLEQFGRDITIKSFDNFAQKTDKTIY
jgi:uracil permease